MQLVSPLASGIRGAKNGSATLLSRGTDDDAAVYLDANGGRRWYGSVALDAFGSFHCYVDEAVDVTVYDEDGEEVRSFSLMSTAGVVEVRSQSFETSPQQLDEALARAETSFGASDFNVLVDGVTMSVKNAFAAIIGPGVNVKSAVYGATGGGSVDDYTPIQQAIDDVFVAGGGTVYLPPGTYAVGRPLRLRPGVSLVGEGNLASKVVATAGTYALVVLAGFVAQTVTGVAFSASTAQAVALVSVDRSIVRFCECHFDGELLTDNLADITANGASVVIERCVFDLVSGNLAAVNAFAGLAARIDVVECSFLIGDGYSSDVVTVGSVHLEACLFDWSEALTGTFSCFELAGECYGTIDGCEFVGRSGPAVTLINIGNLNSSREFVFEDCSVIEQSVSPTMYVCANAGSEHYARMKTIDARCAALSTIATVGGAGLVHYVAPDVSQYGVWSVRNDDNTAGATASGCCFGASTTSAFNGTAPRGARRTMIYAMKNAEDFTLNDNVARNSVMPTWKSIASSACVMKFVMMREYGYTPSEGMLMRWHACGFGGGQPTVDANFREAYAF